MNAVHTSLGLSSGPATPPAVANCAAATQGVRSLPVPFLLITGGKGGVGKTTLAANLSVHLARGGHRVLLVDLDLGLADLDLVLSLRPRRTLEDAMSGKCSFADCLVEGPGGLMLLPAASGDRQLVGTDEQRRNRLLAGLAEIAGDFDVVIGDGASGIGPDVLTFAAVADRVLLVTTPELPAVTDAFGLIKAMDSWSRESGAEVPTPSLIINLASSFEEAQATAVRLKQVCERFLARSPRSAGWLPKAASIGRSGAGGAPFALGEHKSLATNCLHQLGARLTRLWEGPLAASGR
jgi:flagellar biosynthesis protein FlhG